MWTYRGVRFELPSCETEEELSEDDEVEETVDLLRGSSDKVLNAWARLMSMGAGLVGLCFGE